tara:strand:+ start:456 stop:1202 length:747 start_codon:yes stop_codon:yes gene_type:complete
MVRSINNTAKNFAIKGLTLLEALVSTAIVGIGFIAVFQLVNYSVSSIDVSSERTKINYITALIAEDILGARDELYGINPKRNTINVNERGRPVEPNGKALNSTTIMKFAEYLEGGWSAGTTIEETNDAGEKSSKTQICSEDRGKFMTKSQIKSIYLNDTEKGAPRNKMARWSSIINSDRYLKCKNDNDVKSVKVYKICSDSDCIQNPKISNNDEIYIGRIQINTNGGKKRRFLYFQADYIAREEGEFD